MLITRQTDYAIRILRALADEEQRSAKEITEAEGVPQQFSYKIMKKLEKAGYIQIKRGAEGGCSLSMDLHKVSLYDLMAVMGDEALMISCMDGSFECTRPGNEKRCSVHRKLCRIQNSLVQQLKDCTLYELFYEP